MPTYIFKMKTKLLIPGLCFCVNSLIGHPVFDEQKGCWIDNKFKEINYQKLIDYNELFCDIVKSGDKLNRVSSALQKLCAAMDDSIRNFIIELQTHSYSLDKIDDEKHFITLEGAVKQIVDREKISLASAIWLYQVIYASPEEITKGDLSSIQEDYDTYLDSLSDSF